MKIYLLKRQSKVSEANIKKGKKPMTSLLLVYHFGTDRKREYEYLNLYLYEKPKTSLEREHNKETLKLAEAIKAQRVLDAQSSNHGFISNVRGKMSFTQFFKSIVDTKFNVLGSHGNWMSTYKHLLKYCNGNDVAFNKVDERFLEGFKEYLLLNVNARNKENERLNRNTAVSYFNKVKTALKEAYNQRIIKDNPASRVKCIKGEDTHRQFLTLEELQQLVATPCEMPEMKTAFLFSALTGLRWSDVKELTWEKISYSEQDGWFITFTQQKTKGMEVLPVSEQAIKLLGGRKADNEKVIADLVYSAWKNKALHKWVKEAGIEKHISFHCARHSFATLQLSMNTDIYTVSKLLGHRHLKTTEIYAKVIDKKKIEAARRIPNLIS